MPFIDILMTDPGIRDYLLDMEKPVTQKKVLRRGHEQAADILVQEMKAKTPVLSGLLRESIGKKTDANQGQDMSEWAWSSFIGPEFNHGVSKEKYLEMIKSNTGRGLGTSGGTSWNLRDIQDPAFYSTQQEEEKKFAEKAFDGGKGKAISTHQKDTIQDIMKNFKRKVKSVKI